MRAERRYATRVRACAKINRSLRVLGLRPDGYHELRTTFQTLALHDTLTFVETSGPMEIRCDEPGVPSDATNLVWRAAQAMWRQAGRRSRPAGVSVRLVKRIPMQAGLGGGSSDAAATLRALNVVWRVGAGDADLLSLAATLGADVPFFLLGGSALGLGRGDLLFSLEEPRLAWVVLVLPGFGVSTKDAFGWFDKTPGRRRLEVERGTGRLHEALGDIGNDLEGPVAARHPVIGRIVRELRRRGAEDAAMSGSGSAVFGLFETRPTAELAAGAARRDGWQAVVTRTLSRRRYRSFAHPETRAASGAARSNAQ